MLTDHRIAISMDGRGRCHDNIFVERLWWTVKHEWVYLRPASNGFAFAPRTQRRSPRCGRNPLHQPTNPASTLVAVLRTGPLAKSIRSFLAWIRSRPVSSTDSTV